MTCQDHTTHDIQGTQDTHEIPETISAGAVAARVAVELAALTTTWRALIATRPRYDSDHAARAAGLAVLSARRAGWWRVLFRAAYHDPHLSVLFARAALIACEDERSRARYWRDTAADWRARAAHQPTSDTAGALSNWAELGMAP